MESVLEQINRLAKEILAGDYYYGTLEDKARLIIALTEEGPDK